MEQINATKRFRVRFECQIAGDIRRWAMFLPKKGAFRSFHGIEENVFTLCMRS